MQLHNKLASTSVPWLTDEGEDRDVCLSTRVRLARNFKKQHFPNKIDREEAMQVWKNLSDFTLSNPQYQFYRLDDIEDGDKQALVANHLISPQHAVNDSQYRALVLNEDLSQSIMINEEDHLRMQTFAPGLATEKAWTEANTLDNKVEAFGQYAFDRKRGYLTSCPTNLGTGLRASVMLHLPAITATRKTGLLQQITGMGMTVRGLFGEGTAALGDLYQLSNEVTLGLSEEDILSNLSVVAQQIVKQERELRQYFLNDGITFEDRAYRALGTLCYARSLSGQETYSLLSLVRLGISLGVIKEYHTKMIDNLFLYAHPGYIQYLEGKDISTDKRDEVRAILIRKQLKR